MNHPAPTAASGSAQADNPCLRCGACCASFRVDFDREEWAGGESGQGVPEGLAVEITDRLCRMRGTDHQPPRCAALVGQVGVKAACGIHEWRPSPCREFGARAPMGVGDEACDAARRRHGLPPL
jgi:Fe-S-cluster containining protein